MAFKIAAQMAAIARPTTASNRLYVARNIAITLIAERAKYSWEGVQRLLKVFAMSIWHVAREKTARDPTSFAGMEIPSWLENLARA